MLINTDLRYTKISSFDDKAVKEIKLNDDELYLYYISKTGHREELCFNNLDDLDYFFDQTIQGYISGMFTADLLLIFISSFKKSIMHQIKTADTGFGTTRNLNYVRYLIYHTFENLLRLHNTCE